MEFLIGLVWLACGIAAASISAGKGRSGFGGFLLGLILGPIGLAIVLLMGKSQEGQRAASTRMGEKRPCPACRELIAFDATVCPQCRTAIPEDALKEAVDERRALQRLAKQNQWFVAGSVAIIALVVVLAA